MRKPWVYGIDPYQKTQEPDYLAEEILAELHKLEDEIDIQRMIDEHQS